MSHGGIPPPFHRSGPPGPFLMQKRERERSLQVGRISCGDDAPLSVSFPSKLLSASR